MHIPRRERGPTGTEELVYGMLPQVWNDRVSAHLAALARKEKIEFLDLLPIVREREAKGETLYRRTYYDHHWTERGHEVAAEALLVKLESMKAL